MYLAKRKPSSSCRAKENTPTTYKTSGESIELKKSEFQEEEFPRPGLQGCLELLNANMVGIDSFLKLCNMVSECCQYSIITPDPREQESF